MDTSVITKYRVKKYLKIFSLVLLFALIGLLIYGYVRILPKDIKYSNVSSSSFTVSWTTKTPTKGAVRVIESNNNLPISFNIFEKEIFNDTRDVRISELISAQETAETVWNSNSFGVKVSDFVTERVVTERGTYYTHHIQVKGLDQGKEYSVMVGDGLLYLNSGLFKDEAVIKTLKVANSIDTPIPTYGLIKNANDKDLPIEELLPVNDGVVYFNYLEDLSGERSNTYSSSLNEDGAWYMDISTAVDSDGELFFEKYSQTVSNIYGELYIDLGPLGQWEKRINMNEASPAQTIVLNIPGYVENPDDPNMLIRVDGSNAIEEEVVKGVSASGCQFVAYCGGCVEGGKECACDPAVLERRGCGGGDSLEQGLQELKDATTTGCSGGSPGSSVRYGNHCKVCSPVYDTEQKIKYYKWEDVGDNACPKDSSGNDPYAGGKTIAPSNSSCKEAYGEGYVLSDGKCVKLDGDGSQECTTTPAIILLSLPEGDYCCINGTDGKVGGKKCIVGEDENKDGKKDEMVISSQSRTCRDPDGCVCIYNQGTNSEKRDEVNLDSVCKITDEGPGEENGGSWCTIGGDCYDYTNNLTPGEYNKNCVCVRKGTTSLVGKPCKDSRKNITNGEYNINGDCVPRSENNLLANEEILGKSCYETVTSLYATSKDNNMYKCENNEFKWYAANTPCNEGSSCGGWFYTINQCINSKGELLDCTSTGKGSFEWIKEEGASSRGAFILDNENLSPGKKCEGESCLCGITLLSPEEPFCPEVNTCTKMAAYGYGTIQDPSKDGKICDTTGRTCNNGVCNGKTASSSILNNHFLNKTYAQENLPSEYIIDKETGKVLGIEPGIYTLKDDEETYVFTIKTQDVKDGKGDMIVYIDSNENGIQDDGERTLSDFSSSVKINAVKKLYTYDLNEGFNFVSLPFLVNDEIARTAAGLLKIINAEYHDSVYSIAKYDGTWKVVGQNVQQYDNNDFQLIPGEGYIVKANKDISIQIAGRPIDFESTEDNAPITFYPGWNLIGVYGSEAKQYTAKSLIQSINKYEPVDFTANNVSRWESDVQRYDGFQLSNENGIDIEYGFDFPINTLQSYFVRILQGKGNWQPELK